MNGALFKGKIIVVTGGTGSIGSEIVRHLLKTKAAQIRVYSRDEHKQWELAQEIGGDPRVRFLVGDVRDIQRMDSAFNEADICFHAAALKHVGACEYNPFEATKTNILGTQNVIDLAIKHNLERVVAISTDKAVNPTSVLGVSKLMMERLIVAANWTVGRKKTRFAAVRFGNVLSSRGSVLPTWLKQIEQGGPLTVTDKRATRFFMNLSEAVDLVFKAADLMKGGEIFVLKMKRKFKIAEFAEETIRTYARGKKIAISYIGLRAGEKLHEDLLTEDEATRALEIDGMFLVPALYIAPSLTSPKVVYKGARNAKVTSYRSDE